jgi:trk system potassium uptake protein TrkH
LDSLFEVASALGTVGLSTGLCSPDLAASLKALLCIDMLLGRVEVLALLVAVWPRTWLGRRRDLH